PPAVPPRYLPSFPTRRSSDLLAPVERAGRAERAAAPAAAARTPRPPTACRRQLQQRSILPGPRQPVRRFETSRPPSRKGVTLTRSEEHTSELQSPYDLVCRLL